MLHLSTTFSSYLLHTFKHLVVLVYSTSQAHVSLFKCKKWLNEPMKHASVCFPDSHLAHPSLNGAFKQQKPNIKLAGYQVQFRLYRLDTRLFCRRLWSAFNTTSTEICLPDNNKSNFKKNKNRWHSSHHIASPTHRMGQKDRTLTNEH